MKLSVLIDATSVIPLADGLSNYIINLIKYLPEESFELFDYTVLVNPGLNREEFTKILQSGKFRVLEKKIGVIGPRRDWAMFWFLRKYKRKFDLIHITSTNYPFSLNGGICTIHDITFKKYFDGSWLKIFLVKIYLDRVMRHCLKRAKSIIAVSHSTRKELISRYRLNNKAAEKITVIHEGWEHLTTYTAGNVVGNEINIPEATNYLFCLGTFRKHKNIFNLLSAFKLAINNIPPTIKLVMGGGSRHLNKRELRLVKKINSLNERVVFTGYLSNHLLEKYYKNAGAFIFPSLSEGFGLPILEAFYYDCPLLCSNTTSLPEIAGDAALLFDPHSPEDMAKTIVEFYKNQSQHALLAAKGREQLKKFSWINAARETVLVYKSILLQKNN